MKTIGLLGGMSWESSAEYYRLINEFVRERLGGTHSAKIVMHSVDFAEIEELQMAGCWDEAGTVLADHARCLEAGGADVLVLCTNTMHKLIDAITAGLTIPALHIGDATAAAITAAGLDTVGLLGTAFTMTELFMRDRLADHGIAVLVPDESDKQIVHRVIDDELVQGVVLDESRAAYVEVIGRLVGAGAQGVILGCTEIEMLISQADSPVPVFPTTRLHSEAAVEWALS